MKHATKVRELLEIIHAFWTTGDIVAGNKQELSEMAVVLTTMLAIGMLVW